jgi:hypothetical protein
MTKHIANYVGLSTFIDSQNSGVWSLFDQFLYKVSRKWLNISAVGGINFSNENYNYHIFTSPGDFIVSGVGGGETGQIEYLIVAGGGGGGGDDGGGGGAGGFRTGITTITSSIYPIVVGNGGPGGTGSSPKIIGSNGQPSSAFGLTATGGGGGNTEGSGNPSGSPGGSGGGGCGGFGHTPGGSGIPGQGNPGAPGNNPQYSGGAGGGAGAAATPTGPGGDGLAAFGGTEDIPASFGTLGPSPGRWFGGGGGCAKRNVGSTGGGAGGGSGTNGVDGTTNTGGGGFGGPDGASNGSAGGSGIVIIRY